MITFCEHDTALCPDCGAPLLYGTKEEVSSWKVYYECGDRCGWEAMAGTISMSDIDHRDEVDNLAREMGEPWT